MVALVVIAGIAPRAALASSTQAKKLWSEAVEWLGLSLELDGALGKRTKFQVFSTAQLMLRVTHGHTHIEKQDPVRPFHPPSPRV
jgi:hypothetical protein